MSSPPGVDLVPLCLDCPEICLSVDWRHWGNGCGGILRRISISVWGNWARCSHWKAFMQRRAGFLKTGRKGFLHQQESLKARGSQLCLCLPKYPHPSSHCSTSSPLMSLASLGHKTCLGLLVALQALWLCDPFNLPLDCLQLTLQPQEMKGYSMEIFWLSDHVLKIFFYNLVRYKWYTVDCI